MPPTTAHPGLPLGPAFAFTPGPGTYTHNYHIHATLAGAVLTTPTAGSTKPQLSVARPPRRAGIPSRLVAATNALPAVNDIVLARVTRLQTPQITVAILVVGETVCADSFVGVVRKEDVRGWEVDRVVLGEGFRVGDVLRGVVISLGDQASYYLSTARNELGVILATSEDGNTMYPISWKEFRDPVTGRTESRKVAKPF
ncbi:exosome 3'-_5 exonuclease subunit ski4 (Csl4) [Xylographa opegraphella]|nr:exosome 3'->5 exonuclease subunit ski4 (Csl4) [Xylographa opegraphella]